jgi:hypothetical protein
MQRYKAPSLAVYFVEGYGLLLVLLLLNFRGGAYYQGARQSQFPQPRWSCRLRERTLPCQYGGRQTTKIKLVFVKFYTTGL